LAHAAITGWGKCLPPAVLRNEDLTQLFETSDEWIFSRTGIRERRISHVSLEELARQMVRNEEMDVAEIEKMLRKRGDA